LKKKRDKVYKKAISKINEYNNQKEKIQEERKIFSSIEDYVNIMERMHKVKKVNLDIDVKDIGKRIKEQRCEINNLLQKYSIKEIEVFKDKYKKLDYVFYQAIIDRKNISNDFLDEVQYYINDNSVNQEDLKRAYESLKNKETVTENIIND